MFRLLKQTFRNVFSACLFLVLCLLLLLVNLWNAGQNTDSFSAQKFFRGRVYIKNKLNSQSEQRIIFFYLFFCRSWTCFYLDIECWSFISEFLWRCFIKWQQRVISLLEMMLSPQMELWMIFWAYKTFFTFTKWPSWGWTSSQTFSGWGGKLLGICWKTFSWKCF